MVTLDQAGRAVDWTQLFEPPASLNEYAEFFWTQARGDGARGARQWRIVADAAAHIIVSRYRHNGRSRTSVSLVGARSRYVDSNTTCREWVAGVRLRAGTLPLLTGLPASDFTDCCVSAIDVDGSAATEVTTRLEAAADPVEAIRHVGEYMERRLHAAGSPDRRMARFARHATGRAARAGRSVRVRDVAASLGLGERNLRNLCAGAIGLSPVLALRTCRLHSALRLALTGRLGLARVAALAGYFDQAHMNLDFRALLGETPREFLGRSAVAD